MRQRLPFSLAFIWFLVTTILLCLPGTEFPEITWLTRIWFDKWVHVGLFLILVAVWCRVYSFKKGVSNSLKKIFKWIGLLGLAYGIIMELIQHYFIPFRGFDYGDILADAAGCLAGFIFSVRRYIKK